MLKFAIIVWKVFTILSQTMNIITNAIVIYDIYVVLRNPFYPRQKRCNQYALIITTISLVLMVYLFCVIDANQLSLSLYGAQSI